MAEEVSLQENEAEVREEEKKNSPISLEDLIKNRRKGIDADQRLFSEQRNNVNLVSGKHHKSGSIDMHIQTGKKSSMVRMTINYIAKYARKKQNRLITHAPMVKVMPKSDDEREDVKSAELSNSVWKDIVYKHNINSLIRKLAHDYISIGEMCVKVGWNPDKGEPVSEEDKTIDIQKDSMDQYGRKITDQRAVFTGDLEFERILPWNLIRPAECTDIRTAPWLCIDRMLPISEVKSWFVRDPKKYEMITSGYNNAYDDGDDKLVGFDNDNNLYADKDSMLVSEMYFRPTPDYPQGLFFIFSKELLMFNGELPYGMFPILYAGYLSQAGSPRHYSIIRDAKPLQAEINQCFSKAIEHSLSIGDDKIFVPKGSSLDEGASQPGIRYIYYNNANMVQPTVVQGRTGIQHLEQAQQLVMVLKDLFDEPDDNKPQQGVAQMVGPRDPQAMIYASYKEKEYNSYFAEDFEQFVVRLAKMSLRYARHYYTPDKIVPVIR